MLHLAVDIMGSDTNPLELFEGVIQACQYFQHQCRFTVLATHSVIQECLKKTPKDFDSSLIEFFKVKEEVLMHESPLLAVRRRKDSSLAVGVELVKNKTCDGLVTSGNTGAITAFSSITLEKLTGIERPALLAMLPTEVGQVAILDVGANVTFKSKLLMQFALMGAAYQKVCGQVAIPKVGLLNIGGEARKGTRIVQQAYHYFNHYDERLQEMNIHFEGNVEGRDVFEGRVDVIVTDGFTGNVFLKTCEGVSSFIIDQVSKRLPKSPISTPKKALKELGKFLDYAHYPGAVLLGIHGVIVKCHGCSNSFAIFNGIKGAFELAKNKVIDKIESELKNYENKLSVSSPL